MSFQSVPFLVSLAISVALYSLLPQRWRSVFLACLSFAFYLTWSLPYTLLLLLVTVYIFYLVQKLDEAEETRKYRILWQGVVLLVVLLVAGKYGREVLMSLPAIGLSSSIVNLVAPLGISYYVFKLLSYLMDVYAGKLSAEHNLAAFAAYVSFFPQILAGPIQRAVDFLPQIRAARQAQPYQLSSGLRLILFGLFKKLVIADALSALVAQIYKYPKGYTGFELLITSYLFAIQLYADFSGITDIAIGSARLFGISSPKNFENPFYAPTIQEFWRRWHITLTSWVRDYVFLPIRMKFRYWGWVGLTLSIFINMILIGLWHGATSPFLWFGIVQGAYMVVSVFTLKKRDAIFARIPGIPVFRLIWQSALTFTLVSLSLIFFRAENLRMAASILSSILSRSFFHLGIGRLLETINLVWGDTRFVVVVLALVYMEIIHLVQGNLKWRAYILSCPTALRWLVYYAMILILFFFGDQSAKPFIYFQF